MTNRIKIVIPGEPRGKGRPRFARRGAHVRTFTDEKTASYENLIAYCGNQAMQGRAPLDCAICATINIFIAPPASWSKKKKYQALIGGIHPTNKPDIDNVIKGIMDGLNGIAWVDDKQVVNIFAQKSYAEKSQVLIEFEPMIALLKAAHDIAG